MQDLMLKFLVISSQRLIICSLLVFVQAFIQSTVVHVPPKITLSSLLTPERDQNLRVIFHPTISLYRHLTSNCWCTASCKKQCLTQRTNVGIKNRRAQNHHTREVWNWHWKTIKSICPQNERTWIQATHKSRLSSGKNLGYENSVRKV